MTQHVVITGANRGIGLALTHLYLHRGARVSAVCRSASEALHLSAAKIIEGIDIAQAEGVTQLATELEGEAVDILINNAGILRHEILGAIDYDTVIEQLLVNAVAPLRVTEALQGNLGEGAKVALITSRMGSIADNGSGSYYGYRMSKAALNAAGMSLARDLAGQGVAVALLHPGFVQTDMVNHAGDVSAAAAAEGLAARIEGLNLTNSGSFWHANGEILPW